MVIQTLEKSYVVVKRCGTEDGAERFICRDGERGGLVTLLRVKDRQVIASVMEYVPSEVPDKIFTDFKGCFVDGAYFCMAMEYHEGMTLGQRLEREHSALEERLEVMHKLLEKAVLLKLPWYFFWDALDPDQVVVSSSLEVEFNYRLRELGHLSVCGRDQAYGRLAGLMRRLFQREFSRQVVPELEEFCRELESASDRYENCLEVYRRYREISEGIAALPPEELKSPRTRPFRLWERVKRGAAGARKLAALLLLTAAVVYLIFTVRQVGLPRERQKVFRYIGTLEITE